MKTANPSSGFRSSGRHPAFLLLGLFAASVLASCDLLNSFLGSNLGTPTAPAAFEATAGDGSVMLAWSEVSGVDIYTVYYKAGSAVSKTAYDKSKSASGTTTTIDTLTNGEQYAFLVVSVKGNLMSPASLVKFCTPTTASVKALEMAYVANFTDNTVSAFTIDPATGILVSAGVFATGTGPTGIAIAPAGKYAYACSSTDSKINAYTISSGTGGLTSLGSAIAAGGSPSFIAINAAGTCLYTANSNNTVSAFKIGTDGKLTTVVGSPFITGLIGDNVVGFAIDPTGAHLYLASNNWAKPAGTSQLASIAVDATTGALSTTEAIEGVSDLWGFCLNPAGNYAYFPESNGPGLSGLPLADGVFQTGSPAFTASNPGYERNIVVDPSGQFLYAMNTAGSTSKNVFVLALDAATGTFVQGSDFTKILSDTNTVMGAFDPAGSFFYSLSTIDKSLAAYAFASSDGSLTDLGNSVSTGAGAAFVTTCTLP